MAGLATLRKEAKELGIPKSDILGASSAAELQKVIANFKTEDEAPKRPVKKSAVAKKKTATKTAAAKKTAAKSKPAAKSKTGNAKRKTTGSGTNGKTKATKTSGYVAKGARNLLDSVDFTQDEGWNARENSAPARIIKALRKARGNRDKAFDALVPDVWDFVGKKMRNGSKRPLKSGEGNAHGMLRYRISRTAWDFALRTGQHEKAGNRVEYGTGGTGQGVWKPAKKSSGSKTKATAKKKTSRKK